jgi:membrane-bound ClpP family serine protease
VSTWRWVGRGTVLVALLLALGGICLGLASVGSAPDRRDLTGVVLILVLASTWGLCAHAGGHAWFVPVPALVLAVLWAITVSRSHEATSWWLAALSATAAAIGLGVGSAALHVRLRIPPPVRSGPHGESGTTVTALTPVGVVRVAGETWTAKSLSGSLPAGAPVHVVRVNGVRLDVWSEAGTVPDQLSLDSEEEQT